MKYEISNGAMLNFEKISMALNFFFGTSREAQRIGSVSKSRSIIRVFDPKVYATGGPRCPVMIYKLYRSHRPLNALLENSHFSFSPA